MSKIQQDDWDSKVSSPIVGKMSEGQIGISKFLFLIFFGALHAQIHFDMTPEISQSTWSIPVNVETNLYESVTGKHSGQLFNTDHPSDNYIWYSYHRNGKTYSNTENYIEYNDGPLGVLFGRKYNPVGQGKMSGLYISPMAPSLDQLTFTLSNYHGFNYRHSIMRLDNRFREENDVNNVVNRWYYLNQVGYNYKNIVEINFTDAVIATGYNRGLEWYYANPLVSLFMERKHELHRREGQDSTSVIGIGDNDNHFVGGDLKVNYNNYTIYGEWLIDEWQLSPEDRPHMQTVFGTLAGIGYKAEKWSLNVEYSLAGPWLYLNRALYGTLEKHGQPIGLRNPQSQSLGIHFKYQLDGSQSFLFTTRLEQKGDQTFETPWTAWDNKIEIFNFSETSPIELRIKYFNKNNRWFNTVSVYHNWLGKSGTYFVISKDITLILE